MIPSEASEQQIRGIEEDDHMMHVYRHKVFPCAIYNLTDNGSFNNFSHTKKLKALKHIEDQDRDIRRKSLFYISNPDMDYTINSTSIIDVVMSCHSIKLATTRDFLCCLLDPILF